MAEEAAQIPVELYQEILEWSTLEAIVNLAQSTYAFRQLILSNTGTQFLSKACRKDPIPLPAGTSLDNPPSNLYNLCVHSVRVQKRLAKADVATALQPQKITTMPLPSAIIYDPNDHDMFVLRDILVVAPSTSRHKLMIVDLSAPRFIEVELHENIDNFSCQMADNNSEFVAAMTCKDDDGVTLFWHSFSVLDPRFGEEIESLELGLPPTMDVSEILIQGALVFVSGVADFVVFDFTNLTGLHVQINNIRAILRLSIHPTYDQLMIEYRVSQRGEPAHIMVFELSSSMPELFPDDELGPIWQTRPIDPPDNAFPLVPIQDPNAEDFDIAFQRDLLLSFRPRRREASEVLQIFRMRNNEIGSLLVFPGVRLSLRPQIESDIPPELTILDNRGIYQWGRYSDAIIGRPPDYSDNLYVLLTDKDFTMHWVRLNLGNAELAMQVVFAHWRPTTCYRLLIFSVSFDPNLYHNFLSHSHTIAIKVRAPSELASESGGNRQDLKDVETLANTRSVALFGRDVDILITLRARSARCELLAAPTKKVRNMSHFRNVPVRCIIRNVELQLEKFATLSNPDSGSESNGHIPPTLKLAPTVSMIFQGLLLLEKTTMLMKKM
ncbi:hypothetical protein SISNIDRAFT_467014 [Sistotremastrum niveocremeum HHB9708]|uniref:Uncharacterized protein n=1 Tax=Sistotremastrum niveocremeum HHB9708 TaxID=1314777 RepID=A0A164T898_9AGAM|nr:hypothetical protein SISNIDRAFT_467014 [Sistotremastrum niveocremeum HHB9708]